MKESSPLVGSSQNNRGGFVSTYNQNKIRGIKIPSLPPSGLRFSFYKQLEFSACMLAGASRKGTSVPRIILGGSDSIGFALKYRHVSREENLVGDEIKRNSAKGRYRGENG